MTLELTPTGYQWTCDGCGLVVELGPDDLDVPEWGNSAAGAMRKRGWTLADAYVPGRHLCPDCVDEYLS